MDDVVLNKAATIERCAQRVRDEYAGDPRNLTENITAGRDRPEHPARMRGSD